MHGAAMPSKTYNIMAAGKPIVAMADSCSELGLVIEENQIGWRSEPRNVDSLQAVLEEVYRRRHELDAIGQQARKEAENSYSLSQAINRYRDALI
jgi:glycosyltransferase involved in cell wall biosynthesis